MAGHLCRVADLLGALAVTVRRFRLGVLVSITTNPSGASLLCGPARPDLTVFRAVLASRAIGSCAVGARGQRLSPLTVYMEP